MRFFWQLPTDRDKKYPPSWSRARLCVDVRLGDGEASLARRLARVPGVQGVEQKAYTLFIDKALLFNWDDVVQGCNALIEEIYGADGPVEEVEHDPWMRPICSRDARFDAVRRRLGRMVGELVDDARIEKTGRMFAGNSTSWIEGELQSSVLALEKAVAEDNRAARMAVRIDDMRIVLAIRREFDSL